MTALGRIVIAAACLLVAGLETVQAQGTCPPVERLLDEALEEFTAWGDSIADSDKDSGDLFAARMMLADGLLQCDRATQAAALYEGSPERDQRAWSYIRDMAVEYTGTIPELPDDIDANQELQRRQTFAVALARRGDFEKAHLQVEAFPQTPQTLNRSITTLRTLAERQAEAEDYEGVSRTARRLWAKLKLLPKEDRHDYLHIVIRIAELLQQSGESKAAANFRGIAEALLNDTIGRDPDEVDNDLKYLLLDLAKAYAAAGQAEQAWKLHARAQTRLEAADEVREEDWFELRLLKAEILALTKQRDDALEAYQDALEIARELEEPEPPDDDLEDIEIIAALLSIGPGTETREVCLGQLELGDAEAAMETWEGMPVCLQKLLTALKMAEALHAEGNDETVRRLAKACGGLDDPDLPAADVVWIYNTQASILNTAEDRDVAGRTITALLKDQRVVDSPKATAMAVSHLIDLGQFDLAYRHITQLDDQPSRVELLAKLASKVAESDQRRR